MGESGAQNPQPRPRVEEHSFSGSGDDFGVHLPPPCGHGLAVHSTLSHTWRGHMGSLQAYLWVTPWSPQAVTQWIKQMEGRAGREEGSGEGGGRSRSI